MACRGERREPLSLSRLQQAGVEPGVWKIEGLERREDCERGAAAARQGNRDRVGCIALSRGEDDRKVRQWLARKAKLIGKTGGLPRDWCRRLYRRHPTLIRDPFPVLRIRINNFIRFIVHN